MENDADQCVFLLIYISGLDFRRYWRILTSHDIDLIDGFAFFFGGNVSLTISVDHG